MMLSETPCCRLIQNNRMLMSVTLIVRIEGNCSIQVVKKIAVRVRGTGLCLHSVECNCQCVVLIMFISCSILLCYSFPLKDVIIICKISNLLLQRCDED